MKKHNLKSGYIFVTIVILASFLTIFSNAQQAEAANPYIQNVSFGQDEQGDYISFDWVGVPPVTDNSWSGCRRDLVAVWFNRFNPSGANTGDKIFSYVGGDFYGRWSSYSGFGNYGFASGRPTADCITFPSPDSVLSENLPRHFRVYINPLLPPERFLFTGNDFITIQLLGWNYNAQLIEVLVGDTEEYHYQVPENPLPAIPYTNVKFGFNENNQLNVSFDWIGPSKNFGLSVGFNGRVHDSVFTDRRFTPDVAMDISMTWEGHVNLNLGYVDSLAGAFLEQGKHYEFPVIELEKWTPNQALRVNFDCGSWWWLCSNPISKDTLESFLGRSLNSDDYITLISYFNDPNKYYFSPQNHPPTLSELGQFDGATSIPEGQILRHPYISSFSANISDPDGEQIKLQVELRRFEEPFTGIDDGGILTSDLVPSGGVARVPEWQLSCGCRPAIQLSDGKYHWRARAIDSNGNKSGWQEFGVIGNVDFEILTNRPPTLSFPTAGPYAGDGVDPNSGNTSTLFTFRVVYTDTDDDTPEYVRLCIEGPTDLLPPCFPSVSAPASIDYTKGWSGALEGMSMSFPKSGTYLYHFEASDGKTTVRLPVTGGFPLLVGSPAQVAVAPAVEPSFMKIWATEISIFRHDPLNDAALSTLTMATAISCLAPEPVATKVFCVGSLLTMWGAKEIMWASYDLLALDPPREDFDVSERIKPVKPVKPFDNSAFAKAMARYATSLSRHAQLVDAVRITNERLQGAVLADKGEYMLLQARLLLGFLDRLGESNAHHQEVIKQLLHKLPKIWNDNMNQVIGSWASEGLSDEEKQTLLADGLSEEDIAKIEKIFSNASGVEQNNYLGTLLAGLQREIELMQSALPTIEEEVNTLEDVVEELEDIVCSGQLQPAVCL